MNNLIQFRLINDKPTFWGLRDVPKYLDKAINYSKAIESYDQAFKSCEEKALRIVNPEVMEIGNLLSPFTVPFNNAKHNDIFPIPEGWEFFELEEALPEQFQSYPNQCEKVLRLVPSNKEEKEEKEETQEELWTIAANLWDNFVTSTEWRQHLQENFTIQRKKQ